MRKLIERTFCNGIVAGIALYQRMIISAHERRKPLKIGEDLYPEWARTATGSFRENMQIRRA